MSFCVPPSSSKNTLAIGEPWGSSVSCSWQHGLGVHAGTPCREPGLGKEWVCLQAVSFCKAQGPVILVLSSPTRTSVSRQAVALRAGSQYSSLQTASGAAATVFPEGGPELGKGSLKPAPSLSCCSSRPVIWVFQQDGNLLSPGNSGLELCGQALLEGWQC